MEKKELVINPAFQPLFSDFVDDPRYYQVYGGRGSGKSFSVAICAVQKTYSPYKHKILYLRQTMSTSEDSTIADVRLAIIMLGVQADFRESKGQIINIKTGSTISFKGIKAQGSATAKLKSLSGITTLIIEEAEEVESFDEFSKVDESIRVNKKPLKVILVYNPTSAIKSWIHKEWFKNGIPNKERLDDTIFIHSTYKDNEKNLNPSVVKRYEDLRIKNPTYYKNTILAEWTLEMNNQVYAGWGIVKELHQRGDTWYGLDFAYGGKDKTSMVKVTFVDDVYYAEVVFSKEKMRIDDMVREMVKNNVPFDAKIYADSAMPLLITEIREKGFRKISKCRKGKVEGEIKKIQNKNICIVGGKGSSLYYHQMTWAEDDKGKLPHEPDELAALRYAINSKTPIKTNKRANTRKIRRYKQTRGFI